MADVVRRTGLDVSYRCELYTGRRADVERLCKRLEELLSAGAKASGVGPAGTGATVPGPEARG
jgi:hypothetical protein